MSFPSNLVDSQVAHIAIFPGAGMGHLTPSLRLASLLLCRHHHHCRVTLITAYPTVSFAESRLISRFLSFFPAVSHVPLQLLPLDASAVASGDPFWLHFEATRRSSAQLLPSLLSSLSPPQLSALVVDVSLITPVVSVADSLSLPCYVLFTSSARMLSLFAYSPNFVGDTSTRMTNTTDLKIPGLASPVPMSSVPPLLLNPTTLFANIFLTDAPKLRRLNGVLINTFEELEPDSLANLIQPVPLFTVGPFPPFDFEFEADSSSSSSSSAASSVSKWLDEQPERSVVYVSFGSRTALPKEQMREVGRGLILSGCRFLWVVKFKKVDKEEEEEEGDSSSFIEEVVGKEVLEIIMKEKRSLVVKKWVNQSEILGHKAVGGFVSHCGWNSVVESAWHGVRILAWPQHGDQKVNAEVVRECGLGMWTESWGWSCGGGDHDHDQTAVLKGEEIGERVREMMGSETLRLKAASVGESARKGGQVGGRRDKVFDRLVDEWKKKQCCKLMQ